MRARYVEQGRCGALLFSTLKLFSTLSYWWLKPTSHELDDMHEINYVVGGATIVLIPFTGHADRSSEILASLVSASTADSNVYRW